MINHLLAERYALGLSAALPQSDELENIVASLKQLRGLFEDVHDFRSILANPIVDIDVRRKILEDVLDKTASPQPVRRLLLVLLRRGRISILPDVTEVFAKIVDDRFNRVTGTVTTAVELDDKHKERICQSLSSFSHKTLRMNYEVDPDICGGVIAILDGTVIDGSLRSQFERLKEHILSEES